MCKYLITGVESTDLHITTRCSREKRNVISDVRHVHRHNGTALDIGAHVGTTAILLSLTIKYLTHNVHLSDRIHLYNKAVSMMNENLEFRTTALESNSFGI